MSARSFLHSVAVVAVAACGSKAPPKPEGDPAQVKTLAATMIDNSPVPAALDRCKDADLAAPITITFRTLRRLAGQPIDTPELADWINPPALDASAAQTILDEKADALATRQAAGELLAAKSWMVYRVDLVNAPMALGVKELKTGFVNARAIRYDRATGRPTCVTVFNFSNTRDKTDWAISVSNRPYVEPAVAKILREDLGEQYAKALPRPPAAPPTPPTH
jgi:hypothetical protein